MAALTYDLAIEQGATFRLVVPVLDDHGAGVDLTGWAARGQIRETHSSVAVLYRLGEHISLSGSNLILEIPGDDTAVWAWSEGVYDIELVNPAGDTARLIQGRVKVSPEVTR